MSEPREEASTDLEHTLAAYLAAQRMTRRQLLERIAAVGAAAALAPVIGYDKASKIAHHAMDNDLTLKQAALQLGFVTEAEFDRVVDPKKMVTPYVATDA